MNDNWLNLFSRSAKWQRYLLNPWFLSALTFFVMTAIALSFLKMQQPQKTILDPEAAAQMADIQQAAADLAAMSQYIEEMTYRSDLNPNGATNPGLLQMTVKNESSYMRQRFLDLQRDTNLPTYQQHLSVIADRSVIQAMKLVMLGAAGQTAILRYPDPADNGRIKEMEVSPHLLQGISLLKLLAADGAQKRNQNTYNLSVIAEDTKELQDKLRGARVNELRVQFQKPVADAISQTDIYGRLNIPGVKRLSLPEPDVTLSKQVPKPPEVKPQPKPKQSKPPDKAKPVKGGKQ